jgi:hypothetical protein
MMKTSVQMTAAIITLDALINKLIVMIIILVLMTSVMLIGVVGMMSINALKKILAGPPVVALHLVVHMKQLIVTIATHVLLTPVTHMALLVILVNTLK